MSLRFRVVLALLVLANVAIYGTGWRMERERVYAQEQAAAPDPSKEIAALKQQVAQLSQPKPLSPAEQTKAAQDGYAMIFKEAKEKAGAACKSVSGRLRVTVASDGKASVACEM